MLQEISLFQGHLIALIIFVAIVALFILLFYLTRWAKKRKEWKALKGTVVEVSMGGSYCRFGADEEGYGCTFLYNSLRCDALLNSPYERIFHRGDRIRARIMKRTKAFFILEPLLWLSDVPADKAIVTYREENGKWRCVVKLSIPRTGKAYQKSMVILGPEDKLSELQAGNIISVNEYIISPSDQTDEVAPTTQGQK